MISYIGKCLLIDEESKRTLVVGDLHIGYEEVLNKTGVFVSRQVFDEIIKDLEDIFNIIGKVDMVILLGDVKHNFSGNSVQEWDEVSKIIEYLKNKGEKVIIIRGNHDNYLKTIAKQKSVEVVDFFVEGEYCFLHGDSDFEEIYEREIKYWIMGHAHPAISLREGAKVERYKCFLEGKYKDKKIVILPSFFPGIEGSDIRRFDLNMAWEFDLGNFEVKIVGDKLEVMDFGKLKNIE